MKYAVQAVILNDKGEVQAVSRKDDHNDFGLVGGKVDPEDVFEAEAKGMSTIRYAMHRECMEETGLDIDMDTAVEIFQMHRDGYMGVTFLIKDWCGEINTDEPHVVEWVPFEVIMNGSFGKWNTMVAESLESMGINFKKNSN